MRIFLLLLFICPSAFAAYSEMIIEGVKQTNGVWTTAGVMDTQGFVRTTGAVSVAGTTKNLPVAFGVDAAASTGLLRVAARAAGPIALAAAAYDVYEWYTSDGIQANGNVWTTGDTSYINGYCRYFQGYTSVQLPGRYTWEDCLSNIKSKATYLPITRIDPPASGWIYTYGTPGVNRTGDFWSFQTVPKPIDGTSDSSLPIPSFPIMSNGFNKIPSLIGVPIPIKGLSFPPFSEWASDPYFKDGNWWRDRMDISPAPTASQPTRVRIEFGPIKLEGMTDPNTPPADTPASGNTQPKEQTKFCDDNPQSIACLELGQLEDEQITPDERPFHITPESPWGQGSASCPNPETETLRTGATVTFSYQPTCDFFSSIRPAVIAVAFLAALYIALGIPAGKGD